MNIVAVRDADGVNAVVAATISHMADARRCLRGTELLAVIEDAFRNLVLPGLTHAGLDGSTRR